MPRAPRRRSTTPGSNPDHDPFAIDVTIGFDDPFAVAQDPFSVDLDEVDTEAEEPPPDSLEAMAAEELDEIAAGFRRRMQREAERLDLVLDTDYWCCLCFQTYDQLVAFLQATGWRRIGERYLDGLAVARALGIELPPSPTWPRITRDSTWDAFVLDQSDDEQTTGEEERA